MSGLEAQQMSNWSDNYRHGALTSLSAALVLTSTLLSDGAALFPQIYGSPLKWNEKQTVNI